MAGTPYRLPGEPEVSNHPVDVGERTEAIVLAELVKRGYSVLTPFGNNRRYDFVLDLGTRYIRVQCKTGRLRSGVVQFSAQSVRVNTRGSHCRPYVGEIDVFVVYCPDNQRLYAVPIEDATSTVSSLRVDPPANRQVKRIRWAADHEMPA